MSPTSLLCDYSGCEITDPEEIANPYCDADGSVLCWECYHEHYEFTCCWCEEYDSIDNQHKMLVVTQEEKDVAPGVYRIVKFPYYTTGIIEAALYKCALKRVADVPIGVDTNGYSCGHLCSDCQKRIKAEAKA